MNANGARPLKNIEYTDTGGDRPPVVFVHSLIAHCGQFAPHADAFSDYRMVCPSLRGHGKSGGPAVESAETYSLDAFASDVIALAESLGIAPFHYVGNSIGGMIGYYLVQNRPDLLLSMTAMASPPRVRVPKLVGKIAIEIQLLATRIMGRDRYGRFAANTACATDKGRDYLKEHFIDYMPWDITRHAMANIMNIDFTGALAETNVPVQIIRPEKDFLFNQLLDRTLKTLAEKPGITVSALPGAGHVANLDNPDGFVRLVRDFIGKVDG